MSTHDYCGLAFIGDPHLSSRAPGFRRDDYPRTALAKLKFCLETALEQRLLPVLLGDVFDRPRDNANWLIGELLDLLSRDEVLAIYGNHDCRENSLTDDDSFSILLKSGHVRLLTPVFPWQGTINGQHVIVGGSPWGQPVPDCYPEYACEQTTLFSVEQLGPEDEPDKDSLVIWVTHHDLRTSPEMQTGIKPDERRGIDIVINGHLHKRQDPIVTGKTTWLIPGNLTRLGRSETSRTQPPAFLRVDIEPDAWQSEYVEIPHEPFDNVFFEAAKAPELDGLESSFVRGLAELQAHRTESGAGLIYFLEQNLPGIEEPIAQEVLSLAELVTGQSIHVDFSAEGLSLETGPAPGPAGENDTPGRQQALF